jgi:hypothetical protein
VNEPDWAALGFDEAEATRLSALRRTADSFPLGRELGLWAGWVGELERGVDWERVELESAWASRDSLDLSLRVLPLAARDRVFRFVDELDRTFRDLTVSGSATSTDPASWWRGRIPLRNGQRLYALDLLDESWRDR